MKFIKTNDAQGNEIKLHYQDWGTGIPVVLVHGWPLAHQMWDYQITALTDVGYRCIAYDRRGFGKSDKPLDGYDYDTLADDLKALIDELGLTQVVLVGFSMGGGEVVRYLSKYGSEKVAKAVLISSVVPYMLQKDDNPDGVPQETIDEIMAGLMEERAGFLGTFAKQFYGVGLLSKPVSEQQLNSDLVIAMQATLKATLDSAKAFSSTDFRSELASIDVPVLVIHGDQDQTVPIKATGEMAASMIAGAEYLVYEGEPHGLFLTAKEKLNQDLIRFIGS
jgi:pimeloyl-ACP methyl ester carboxylesterase